ncbi:hypothetical protein BD311DRAFT_649535 [Dichomitus squalens]|uniref:RRM domain-containing protein n=1 Tax=Dichomitus squalens TaxID=114155 RepID=A0A4V2K209_9APHY|nr:hypothetical protein BD311DRAFT_649535 [Dichomitus squalens]
MSSSPSLWVSPGRSRQFNGHSIDGSLPPTPISPGGPLILHMPPAPGSHVFPSPAPSPKGETVPQSTWATADSPSLTMRSNRTAASSTRWADQVTDFYEGNMMSLSSLSLHTHTSAGSAISDTVTVLNPEMGPPIADAHHKPSTSYSPITPKSDRNYPQAVDPITSTSRENAPPTSDADGQPDRTFVNPHVVPYIPGDRRREIDPSTVFVGGLDMPGRDDWDENTLRQIFDRFGVIESVHIVRPLNKRTAFAFVKFTSPEAANRAVQEEYTTAILFGYSYGTALLPLVVIGVQDAVAGGDFLALLILSGEPPPLALQPPSMVAPSARPVLPSSWSEHESRFVHADLTEDALRGRNLQDAATGSTSSISSSTTKVPSLRYETSYGAISTTASPTPPPSSSSVSTPTSSLGPVAPYPLNVGYFPPQPWVQPYAPSYPYAVPMVPGYGYAGYTYPPMQPVASAFYAREPGQDATNHVAGCTGSVSAGDGTYKDPDNRATVAPYQSVSQPPLRATGFIQNEHGTLIPVYQREALDQYMASAFGGQGPPSQQIPPHPVTPFAPSGGTPWHQGPALPVHPGGYPVGFPRVTQPPSGPPGQHRFWMPCPVPYGGTALPAPNLPPFSTPCAPASLAPRSSSETLDASGSVSRAGDV